MGFAGYVVVCVQLYCRCFTVLHLVVTVYTTCFGLHGHLLVCRVFSFIFLKESASLVLLARDYTLCVSSTIELHADGNITCKTHWCSNFSEIQADHSTLTSIKPYDSTAHQSLIQCGLSSSKWYSQRPLLTGKQRMKEISTYFVHDTCIWRWCCSW
jgi:hypothetical protein